MKAQQCGSLPILIGRGLDPRRGDRAKGSTFRGQLSLCSFQGASPKALRKRESSKVSGCNPANLTEEKILQRQEKRFLRSTDVGNSDRKQEETISQGTDKTPNPKEKLLRKTKTISGDNGMRAPPVPIPNTEVKPHSADGTWLETARESRSSPDSNERYS